MIIHFPFSNEGSDFIDKDHEHIVTGNLRIMRPYKKALKNNNISWKGIKHASWRVSMIV